MIRIIVISLLICMLGVGQSINDTETLSHTDLIGIARKIVSANLFANLLSEIHDTMSPEDTLGYDKQSIMFTYNQISRLDTDISIIDSDSLFLDNNIEIFTCRQTYVADPTLYTLAVGYDGTFYYLMGFEHNDLTKLIRHCIGRIDSPEKVVKAFRACLRTRYYPAREIILIDSSNCSRYQEYYQKKNPKLYCPVIRRAGGRFQASFYFIDKYSEGKKLQHYSFVVTRDGLFSQTTIE